MNHAHPSPLSRRQLLASALGGSLLAWGLPGHAAGADLKPEAFGAVGDGRTDDTAALQAALNQASDKGLMLVADAGKVYSVVQLVVRDGLAGMNMAAATLKGRGNAPDAVLVLGKSGAPVKKARISVRIDMSEGDRVAIKGYDTVDCVFTGCKIAGFTDHLKLNHYGILLSGPASRNTIRGNEIRGVTNPIQRGLLIDLLAGGQAEYGGFYEGLNTRATQPCVENLIEGNQLEMGSYAVNLLGGERNIIRDNRCIGQNHRGVYLANASADNLIEGNQITDYLSSAVVLGYAASGNTVRKNRIRRDAAYASGEAAININTGASRNTIVDNSISAATNYGVYMACDVVGNVVRNNEIENFYLAGIAIESDWKSPRPQRAIFSRPNYAPPVRGSYSHQGAVDNAIIGNTLRAGYSGRKTTAIYLAQVDAGNGTGIKGTIIQDNQVLSNQNLAYNLYVYSDQENGIEGTQLIGNQFHEANKSLSVNGKDETSWSRRLARQSNNRHFEAGAPGR